MTRVAIAGSGVIAGDHVRALAALPGVEIAYVHGSDLARAERLAALAPGAVATVDYERILADPSVVAVDVCNATPAHAAFTVAAGTAGKHVHVEKPAALSLADLDRMIAATEGSGRTLMVGQTVRFQPAVAALAAAIADGAIGRPRLAHVSWYTGYVWPGGWRGWQLDRDRSGGHPVHNGTHLLDVASWLLGRTPVRVFARSFPSFAAGMPVHDSFQLIVRFDDDSLATLEISYSLAQPRDMFRRIVVAGTEGTVSHSTDDDPVLHSAGAGVPLPSVENAMGRQLAHWIDVVEGRAEPIVRTDQVRSALAAAIAAQRSLDTGRPVDLREEEIA
ncbi:Gfo/Idh/MocA family oxidoreductase [Microbacterium capsulatum]|uniref:Gfo/Idh/MocA family oxidoreductase n=1 Tax=Microbacterium capsulatum TaxID=3041921 RepID=A0ABU0XDS0_9MICO|nr:Gfo/Idh/MocA family oxidoreductase [Microbacterium sp. ASV81]MDQ4213097.1 Gfo/Idh/MocA family oxidoreductase [Microbacterium sp. ASV81]